MARRTRIPRVILMVKAPRVGQVKKRLGREVGAVDAWRIYRLLLRQTIARLGRDRRWHLWIALSPDSARTRSFRLAGAIRPKGVLRQGQGDLGRRMGRTFLGGPAGPAVMVGGDIPDLGPQHIRRALRLLARHDAVLGPAGDGGYWLVGFRQPRRAVLDHKCFEGVRWSTSHTSADTARNLARLAVGYAPALDDLDNGADWRRWRRRRERRQPGSA